MYDVVDALPRLQPLDLMCGVLLSTPSNHNNHNSRARATTPPKQQQQQQQQHESIVFLV